MYIKLNRSTCIYTTLYIFIQWCTKFLCIITYYILYRVDHLRVAERESGLGVVGTDMATAGVYTDRIGDLASSRRATLDD